MSLERANTRSTSSARNGVAAPHPIRAVLFDLDNTLADRDAAFSNWCRWFARERLALTNDEAIAEVVATMVAMDDDGRLPRETFFHQVKSQHPRLDAEVDELVEAFRSELSTHLPPLDDAAAALLAALDGAQLPWGIVTNGSSQHQRRKLRHLGLETRAGCILISEDVGLRKPDAAIFRLAAERLGVPTQQVLFVGDHPAADVMGAARTGMQTAWLQRNRSWPDHLTAVSPDHQISSLRDVHVLVFSSSLPR